MASVVLVDATDMKEYVVHLNKESAKRAATDVAYALTLLNAEKARVSGVTLEDGVPIFETSTAVKTTNNADGTGYHWSYVETNFLIKEYKRVQPLILSGRTSQKKCWRIIANALNKEGIAVTATQCDTKYTALKRTYRSVLRHFQETGQMRSWQFYKEMESLLSKENLNKEARSTDSKAVEISSARLASIEDWSGGGESTLETLEVLEEEIAAVEDGSEGFRWTHGATMLLIEEAMKVRQLCESGIITQRKCWERVAAALSRHGHLISPKQCVTKFHSLRRTHRSINDYNARIERGEGVTERRRMEWVYFEVVGKMLEESWTCTLNSNTQEDNSSDLQDADLFAISNDNGDILNKTAQDEDDIAQNRIQNGTDQIDLVMDCDEDGAEMETLTTPLDSGKLDTGNLTESSSISISKWCDNATRLLIAEFKEKRNTVGPKGTSNGKTIYALIAESLEGHGYSFTPDEVENYWKILVNAFRTFGTGKSDPTVRIAPYYAELRMILGKNTSLMVSNEKVPKKFLVPRRGVLVAKPPPHRRLVSGSGATLLSPKKNLSRPAEVLKSGNNFVKSPRGRKTNPARSKIKEDALSTLRELKEEIAKQSLEMEKQIKQRETFCEKILEQNEIMIRQRERRNELLEELVLLRRKEFAKIN